MVRRENLGHPGEADRGKLLQPWGSGEEVEVVGEWGGVVVSGYYMGSRERGGVGILQRIRIAGEGFWGILYRGMGCRGRGCG